MQYAKGFIRVFVLCLSFVICFNFLMVPKINAIGVELILADPKLSLFLLLLVGAGVVLSSSTNTGEWTILDDAEFLMLEFENKYGKLPDPKKPEDRPDITGLIAFMCGMTAIEHGFKNLLKNIRDFFNDLGAKEGENSYAVEGGIQYFEELDSNTILVNKYYFLKPGNLLAFNIKGNILYLSVDEEWKLLAITNSGTTQLGGRLSSKEDRLDYNVFIDRIRIGSISAGHFFDISAKSYYPEYGGYEGNLSKAVGYEVFSPQLEIPTTRTINYYVTKNSYVTAPADTPPPVYPNLPYYPNVEKNIPEEKKELIVNPDGSLKEIYDGSLDDFVDDLINNVPLNDLYTPTIPNVEINDDGEIEIGTPVAPLPDIDPLPDDLVVPLPDDLVVPVEIPDDVPDELVPTGLGKIIWLLKQILSWVVGGFRSIGFWFQNFFKILGNLILKLFVPQPEFFKTHFDNLYLKIATKLKVEEEFKELEGLKKVNSEPYRNIKASFKIGPVQTDELVVVNMEEWGINRVSSAMSVFFRGFFAIAILLFNINQAYFLVRGTWLIKRGKEGDLGKKD